MASIILIGTSLISQAQVAVTNIDQVYTQDFTALTPVNIPWVNNFSLPGWYVVRQTNEVNTLLANDGSTSIADLYNFGINADPGRSLGAIVAPDQSAFIGLRITNTQPTNYTISAIDISYRGKQWRRGNFAGEQALRFFTRKNGTDFLADTNNAGWTAQPTFDFISPQTNDFPAILDGNNPTNQIFITNTLTGLSIASGEELWLRWSFISPIINGHGLAIDDVSLTIRSLHGDPPPLPPTNSFFTLSDVQLTLKKPKLNKPVNFASKNGFPIKGFISATTSVVTKASYVAFATSTNTPTNLVFTDAGLFKTKIKKKLTKQGVVALLKHKAPGAPAKKPGVGIGSGTPSVTLIVKVDGIQGTNVGSALFTNTFTSKVK